MIVIPEPRSLVELECGTKSFINHGQFVRMEPGHSVIVYEK